MRKTLFLFLAVLIISAIEVAVSDESLNEILSKPQSYDGKTVILTGEVVGIAIKSENGYFIQLNQDPYTERSIAEGGRPQGQNVSIAVYVKREMLEKISNFGDFKTKGDIVTVRGKFNLACNLHGGETDIHADELIILKPGYALKHSYNKHLAFVSVILFAFSAFLFLFREGIRNLAYRIIIKKERM